MPPLKRIVIEGDDTETKPALIHKILLNRALQILVVILVIAVLLPALLYAFIYADRIKNDIINREIGTCVHNRNFHIRCGIENLTATVCRNRGCCYIPGNGCYHSLPSRHQYTVNDVWEPNKLLHPRRQITPLGIPTLPELRLFTKEISTKRLQIEFWDPNQITDPNQNFDQKLNNKNNLYRYDVYETIVLEVYREKNSETLITTARGPLIAANNYFEWNIYLGTTYLYGLGSGKLESGFKTLLINTRNLNSIPFIMAYNNITNEYHGIQFSTAGPVEIEILPSSLIMFRAMTSVSFRVDVLVGPTPKEIITQIRPHNEIVLPPFWGYGVHVCRNSNDFKIAAAINELNEILDANLFPFDSHCFHDDLLSVSNYKTIIESAETVITKLKSQNKKFLASFTAQITPDNNDIFTTAVSKKILLRKPLLDDPYRGLVNNITSVYIDWVGASDTSISEWLTKFWPTSDASQADGYVLQSNWMRDDSTVNQKHPEKRYFSFIPEDLPVQMLNMTPWNVRLSDTTSSYIIHSINLMGPYHASIMRNHLPSDIFLITSSFTINTPAAVIMQNFNATWGNLKLYADSIVNGGLVGLNFIGASVCGDVLNQTVSEELCIRWYQFASLTPLFRVQSDRIPSNFTTHATRLMSDAIRRRYSLIGYFNTIMMTGDPLITPMFYYYNHLMQNLTDLSEQYQIGEGLLAAPVLLPRVAHKRVYLPDIYYEFNGGIPMPKNYFDFPVVESDLPLFIRSGFIIPTQKDEKSLTAEQTRLAQIQLTVALKNIDDTYIADGKLIITHDLIWIFSSTDKEMKIEVISTNNDDGKALDLSNLCDAKPKFTSSIINSIKLFGHPTLTTNDMPLWENDVDIDICKENPQTFKYPEK